MREKAAGGVCGGQAEVRPTAAALQASARAAESVVKKGKKIIKNFAWRSKRLQFTVLHVRIVPSAPLPPRHCSYAAVIALDL